MEKLTDAENLATNLAAKLKEEQEKVKSQKLEIDELRKKIEDRNPAFNGNLLRRVDSQLFELQKSIGAAIAAAVGQDLVYAFKDKKLQLSYVSSSYDRSYWHVTIDKSDSKEISDKIANLEMKKFQESLDNFSWAVNQQRGV